MAGGEHPVTASLTPKGNRSSAAASVSVKRKAAPETEQARRRAMSGLFAELAALIPGIPARVSSSSARPRLLLCPFLVAISRAARLLGGGDDVQATKTRVLEEAAAYVGALRATAAELESHRAAAARTDDGPVASVVEASCFAVRLPAARRPGSLARVMEVFYRHGVAVLAATVMSNGGEAVVTVTTSAVAPGAVESIKADISSSVP
jgi:hypothetical protein